MTPQSAPTSSSARDPRPSPPSAPGESPDWNPAQYHRFAVERSQPFLDLLSLIRTDAPIELGVDLGCGSGELTALAAHRLGVGHLTGIDSSPSMLAAATEHERQGLEFRAGDLADWTADGDHDLVLANASLQWVPDHRGVLARWRSALAPGGQLAVQVPSNAAMPSHTVAAAVAASAEFAAEFGPQGPPADPVAQHVLAPEQYAALLHELGFVEQHVRLQVYPHLLARSRDVVEWVRGTTLTRFERTMSPAAYQRFLRRYEEQLLTVIGHHEPYFFPFRRVLLWGRLPR